MILNLLAPKFGPACFLVTAKKVFVSPCSSIRFANSLDAANSPPSLFPTIFIPEGSVMLYAYIRWSLWATAGI